MIDLHFHALPRIDDGPPSLEEALALCAAAAADGTTAVVATPHVNFDYPDISGDTIEAGVRELRGALAQAGTAIDLHAGAEVALVRAGELTDGELRRLALGSGSTLLLELPWRSTSTGMAAAVRRVGDRGFGVLLAHPERTPVLRDNVSLVEEIVEAGAWCCLNAASLGARASRQTRQAGRHLLERGLIHAIASDAHDLDRRRPDLGSTLRAAGMSPAEIAYFTEDSPQALLEGFAPDRPPPVGRRRVSRLPWRPR